MRTRQCSSLLALITSAYVTVAKVSTQKETSSRRFRISVERRRRARTFRSRSGPGRILDRIPRTGAVFGDPEGCLSPPRTTYNPASSLLQARAANSGSRTVSRADTLRTLRPPDRGKRRLSRAADHSYCTHIKSVSVSISLVFTVPNDLAPVNRHPGGPQRPALLRNSRERAALSTAPGREARAVAEKLPDPGKVGRWSRHGTRNVPAGTDEESFTLPEKRVPIASADRPAGTGTRSNQILISRRSAFQLNKVHIHQG